MRVSANRSTRIGLFNKNFFRGFTLIELMVVMAVMSVFSVFALANYKSLKETQNLKSATYDVQNLIRQAQSNAVIRLNCNSSPSNAGATWSVVFRDASNIDLKCQVGIGTLYTIKTVNLSSSLQFDSITGSCLSVFPSTTVTVAYAPLLGQVSFSAANDPSSCVGGSGVTGLTVVMRNQNTNETNSFKINKGGAVNGQ